jgi:hypothetical protein
VTPLRYELRRGVGLAFLPVLVLVHSLMIYWTLWPDVFVWLNYTSGVVSGVLLSGPVAAAMAAWTAGRERRRGTAYLRLTSARGEAAVPLVELAACLIVAVAAYVLAAAGGAAFALVRPTTGGPNWAWLGVGALGLILLTTVGYLIGRLLAKVWVPPMVAIATYVLTGWVIVAGDPDWIYLSPVSQEQVAISRDVNAIILAGQALWYAALAALCVAVLLAVGGSGSWRTRTVSATTCVVVAAAGALTVSSQNGEFLVVAQAPGYRCSSTHPTVCVHPAFADGLPELSQRFVALDAKLAGTPAARDRIEQLDRDASIPTSAGAGRFALDGLTPFALSRALSEFLDSVSVGGQACYTPQAIQSGASANVGVVRAWLLDDPTQMVRAGQAQTAALAWLTSLTDPQRRAWFRDNYPAIVACTLTDSAFQ